MKKKIFISRDPIDDDGESRCLLWNKIPYLHSSNVFDGDDSIHGFSRLIPEIKRKIREIGLDPLKPGDVMPVYISIRVESVENGYHWDSEDSDLNELQKWRKYREENCPPACSAPDGILEVINLPKNIG